MKDGFFRPRVSHNFMLWLIIFGVYANGFLLLISTLLSRVIEKSGLRDTDASIAVPLLVGITFIYLASLLNRRKKTAWVVTVGLYLFLLGTAVSERLALAFTSQLVEISFIRNIVVPAIVLSGLLYYRKEFRVKSDLRNFAESVRVSIVVLIIALLYGVVGFQLLDARDFHKEITLVEATHRTIDQFDITTASQLKPYTRSAKLFLDSLSIVSTASVAYVFVSLFQPIKAKFTDQSTRREKMKQIIEARSNDSEDFFKLWPHDKEYFVNASNTAALAFHVERGQILGIGDPVGNPKHFKQLIQDLFDLAYVNDWDPSFVHIQDTNTDLYKSFGMDLQKIGEEAVVDIEHFCTHIKSTKYFRHISNKFEKLGYKTEVLAAPHNSAVVERLHEVSNDWLALPGREERGLMMGYFSAEYLQQCDVMVARDAAGTIQAFLNLLPPISELKEANYDFLRHSQKSPGNINDYLLINLIDHLKTTGYTSLNLGLCPLSGLIESDEDTIIDNALRFVYANGNRIYSFSGLRRFKEKYEPSWRPRYVAYKGGAAGFTRSMYAFNKAMNRHGKKHNIRAAMHRS